MTAQPAPVRSLTGAAAAQDPFMCHLHDADVHCMPHHVWGIDRPAQQRSGLGLLQGRGHCWGSTYTVMGRFPCAVLGSSSAWTQSARSLITMLNPLASLWDPYDFGVWRRIERVCLTSQRD